MKTEIPEFFNIGTATTDAHLKTKTEHRTALVVEEPGKPPQRATFGDLARMSSRFHALLARLVLENKSRVLIRLPNSVDYPITFYGAMKAGMIAVPTSTLLTAKELLFLAEDSLAEVLVIDKEAWKTVAPELAGKTKIRFVFLSGVSAEDIQKISGVENFDLEKELSATLETPAPVQTRADDPAYLVYTSGTTGYPKGVVHAHRSLLGRQAASDYWFDFREHDYILHSGKFNWTYVLGTGMMDPLYHGKTVIVYEGENSPERWLSLIREQSCTIFIGVPTIFRQILQKSQAGAKDVPTLRHCMCAGEHLTDEVYEGWLGRFGFPIYEGLGMSECSYYISQGKKDPIIKNSAGKIQPGHLARLLDENLQPVPVGHEGMICIHRNDPGLFLEYWRAPEQTATQFRDGWFLTGDYAIQNSDGYIFFLGRRDDIIKSFGYRVSPFEIERVFRDHPEIEDIVAFAEHLGREKTLISMCVLLKNGKTLNEGELLSWGKQRLASYKLPKKVYQLEKFPRSANGKVLRAKIPGQLGLV